MNNERQHSRIEQSLFRSDAELPPELRDKRILEVRNMSSRGPEKMHLAYQIVFDQHYLPYSYWNPKPEGWEITYARTEYHNKFDGLLSWLVPDNECICIVVTKEVENHVLG